VLRIAQRFAPSAFGTTFNSFKRIVYVFAAQREDTR
jgi:hypothetical protein